MTHHIADPIGALWLSKHLQFEPFQALPVKSGIAGRRSTVQENDTGYRVEFYQEHQRPQETIIAHLQFHLRHEIPHFEFLTRLFNRLSPAIIQDWINNEPTGQYARRVAFLYEFFTENQLIVPENLGGNYVDVINSKNIVTASPAHSEKNTRWRVNNNLAGNRHFCPLLIKNSEFLQASNLDIQALLSELNNEVGEDFLLRSTAWFTLGESKSSFKIEGEEDKLSRVQRFAKVIDELTGKIDFPENLNILQEAILGKESVIQHFGLRQSPVFVGQTRYFQNIVHYIAPPASTLKDKLSGLKDFWRKTEGQSALLRSAVVAFAFVYIHPLADGNGRVHRFLFNDLLRKDGVTSAPIILPVSGVIASSNQEKIAYSAILDEISKPLMRGIEGYYSFSRQEMCYPDGIYSNLEFKDFQIAEPLWCHPNLTAHVLYFAGLIRRTITHYMREESHYLRCYELAKEKIKEVIEMPDHYADRIIRSVLENNGVLTNKLAKDYPFLKEEQVWQTLTTVIKAEMEHYYRLFSDNG